MKAEIEPDGAAALSICESLLLALGDKLILSDDEIVGLLRDAAQSHSDKAQISADGDHHRAVVHLIDTIILGGNPVRERN